MFIYMYVVEMTHGMHSCSVPTSTLVVFKPLNILMSANMCGIRSTGVVHRFLKWKVVVKHTKHFLQENYALAPVYIIVCY